MSTVVFDIWVKECLAATGGTLYPLNYLCHDDDAPRVEVGHIALDGEPEIALVDGEEVKVLTVSINLHDLYGGNFDG